MDVETRLDEAIAQINGARSLPMSASCVLNRPELIRLLEEAKAVLPEQLADARELVAERDTVVAEGRAEAERIIARAARERAALVSETEVAREARREAEAILAKARRDAEEVRRRADDYVDVKLATFEVVLGKTLEAVGRGREKLLAGRSPDELGGLPDGSEPADGAPGAAVPAPAAPADDAAAEAEVPDAGGFFDTSVIDVERLRKLNEQD